MNTYSNIIFDLDGTLTNPYEGIFNALIYTLKQMNYQEIPDNVPANFIGPPLQKSFSTIYGFNERNTELAVQHYRDYYKKTGLYENVPYVGIEELLSALNDDGKKLFIATSKLEETAWEIIRHFELDKYFVDLKGADYSGHHSKGDLIINLIDRYRLPLNETVMIGDTQFDMIGATDAEIDRIAVGYGFGKIEDLNEYNPVAFAETVEDLTELFY